jgi:hypothetical protein
MRGLHWVQCLDDNVEIVFLEGPQIHGTAYYETRDQAIDAAIAHFESAVELARTDLIRQRVVLFKLGCSLESARSLRDRHPCLDKL